jgi:hypothetical protein
MSEHDFSFRSQDVDYLGFLEAQLRDLQGIHTLAYEMMQNADDVKDNDGRSQTSTISFDVTDEALIIENDGVFRDVDFDRLQNLAGGGKRDETGTTGAFGIGFTAVYQITDAPQIFSQNRHWTIVPDALPDQRIRERQVPTNGTRFVLPWAFDGRSPIRRALRIDAVTPDQFESFVASLGQAIQTASLFLTQLHTLIVLRNGRLINQIKRTQAQANQIILQNLAGEAATWLILTGDFNDEATQLRTRYPWQIEDKRQSKVRLALPAAGLDEQGRLFAVLPSNSMIPLPFHISADFYPTTDRKRIHFSDGYQAEWNQAAILCAAKTVAHHFHTLPRHLGPVGLWQLVQACVIAQQMVESGELPSIFAAFWHNLAPLLPYQSILFTAGEQWVLPNHVRLLQPGVDDTAVSLLTHLKIPIVHPDLFAFQQLMAQPEIGTTSLTVQDITAALVDAELTQPTDLFAAPPFLRSLEVLQTLWQIIDKLLNQLFHPERIEEARAALRPCAVVLTESMMLTQIDRVYQGKETAKRLFPHVNWLHTAVSFSTFPGNLVQPFGVRQAVELLAQMPIDQLEYEWRMGRLDLPALFRWFESNQIEIFADDPTLQQEISRLPLCPVGGELRPLAHLYIPGGFDDPLGLAGLVDLDAIGGRSQFLHDLGARELDFDTYVSTKMPYMLSHNHDIPSDARYRLVRLLAEHLGEFRDDLDLQEQLGELPLVASMDGTFRAANATYATRDAVSFLGERVHIAEPVESGAVQALHHWLGVRERPSAADIVQTLLAVNTEQKDTDKQLDIPTYDRMMHCWVRLNEMFVEGEIDDSDLAALNGRQLIPNPQHELCFPAHLFWADSDSQLAASFIDLGVQVVEPDEKYAAVWQVVGVKQLEQSVSLTISNDQNGVIDEIVQHRIGDRIVLIERALRSEGIVGETAVDTTILKKIRVLKLPQLHIQVQITVGEKLFKGEETTVAAKWDATTNTLYLSDAPQTAWTAVARELTVALMGGKAKGSLAIIIREILTQVTFAAASQSLDELGYL